MRGNVDEKVLINILVEIAGLEQKLAVADHTLKHHTARERDLRALQDEYEDDAAAAHAGDQDVSVRLRTKENEIRAAEAALARKKEQLLAVTDDRQQRAVHKEIMDVEDLLAKAEDEALDLLLAQESAEEGSTAADSDRARQAVKGQAEISRMDSETTRAVASRTELVAERNRLLSMLPEAVRRHAERLQRNRGQAVVHLESGACGGCFSQLPAQVGIDVDRGRTVVRCPSCARFIVHRSWH